MNKEDLINKYKRNIPEIRVSGIWDEIYEINKIVRYNSSVYKIVDMICGNILKMMEIENNIKSLKYNYDNIGKMNFNIKRSGVYRLRKNEELYGLIASLDKEEKEILCSYDLGVSEDINKVEYQNFRKNRSKFSNKY